MRLYAILYLRIVFHAPGVKVCEKRLEVPGRFPGVLRGLRICFFVSISLENGREDEK